MKVWLWVKIWRMIYALFFLLWWKKKIKLSEKLKKEIKIKIRKLASPRHVPSKIIQVSDIPRTKNGKIVELAVKSIIEGNKLKNIQAIANPNILEEFKNIPELN